MATLNATLPHYIRCVKPNEAKRAAEFSAPLVLQQLRYSGVFEAVKIRQQGFPFRWTYHQWYARFHCAVSPFAALPLPVPGAPRQRARMPPAAGRGVPAPPRLKAGPGASPPAPRDAAWYRAQDTAILATLEVSDAAAFGPSVKRGRTQLLYRADTHRKLQRLREHATLAAGALLQRVMRGHVARVEVAALLRMRAGLLTASATRTLPALDAALAAAAASLKGEEEEEKSGGHPCFHTTGSWCLLPSILCRAPAVAAHPGAARRRGSARPRGAGGRVHGGSHSAVQGAAGCSRDATQGSARRGR